MAVTQWVENPTGGRDRGPGALARAWLEVLIRPRRFFHNGIATGDQTPGLVFGVFVALFYIASLLVFTPNAVFGPRRIPVVADSRAVTAFLFLIAVALFVAPAVLHLTAAVETLCLVLLAPDRGGVSQTVQVIAYATAPCVFAGLPVPILRVACALYGAVLLVVGTSEVHEAGLVRAAVVVALPAVLVFGYAFGGFGAATSLVAAV